MADSRTAFDRLEMRRFEARITVEELAQALGVRPESYYRWRAPMGPTPTADSVERYSIALDLLLDSKIAALQDHIRILQRLTRTGQPRPGDGTETPHGNTATL